MRTGERELTGFETAGEARAGRWRIAGVAALAVSLVTAVGAPAPARAQLSAGCLALQGGALTQANSAAQQGTFTLNTGEILVFSATNPVPGGISAIFDVQNVPTGAAVFNAFLALPQTNLQVAIPDTVNYNLLVDPVAGVADITSNCLAAPNPTDAGTVDTLSWQTASTGVQNIANGFTNNVNARFFGGQQTASAGAFFQLASAYRMSGLSQRAQNKVAVTPGGRMRWSGWLQGNMTRLADATPGASFAGNLYSVTGGVDYLVTDDILVGALFAYETYKLDTSFNAGSFEGTGVTIGPYVGVRFLERFAFNLLFAYSWLANDVTGTSGLLNASGTYKSTRWLTAANLSGHWQLDRVRLSPALGVIYSEDSRDAFTNSAGQVTAASVTKFGRVSFGPEVGVTVYWDGANQVEPFISFKGQYDFELQGSTTLNSGTTATPHERLSGRIGFGVNARLGPRFSLQVGGFYDGIGRENYETWSAEGRVRARW